MIEKKGCYDRRLAILRLDEYIMVAELENTCTEQV